VLKKTQNKKKQRHADFSVVYKHITSHAMAVRK